MQTTTPLTRYLISCRLSKAIANSRRISRYQTGHVIATCPEDATFKLSIRLKVDQRLSQIVLTGFEKKICFAPGLEVDGSAYRADCADRLAKVQYDVRGFEV